MAEHKQVVEFRLDTTTVVYLDALGEAYRQAELSNVAVRANSTLLGIIAAALEADKAKRG